MDISLAIDTDVCDFLSDFLDDNFDDDKVFDTLFNDFEEFLENENKKNPAVNEKPGTPRRLKPKLQNPSGPTAKKDVKRTYPKKFEAAANAHDYTVLLDTLKQFCMPNLKGIFAYPRGNTHGRAFTELDGTEVFADCFYTALSAAPDCVFLLHDTQIMEYENGTSLILCKFSANGSRLHTVTAKKDGELLPVHPSVQALNKTLEWEKKHKLTPTSSSAAASAVMHVVPNGNDSDGENEEEDGGVRAKDLPLTLKGSVSKYDRYKRQKVDTMGAYVAHKAFSENSLKPATIATAVAVSGIKTEDGLSSSAVPPEHADISRECFEKSEVLLGTSKDMKFGLSEALPAPVRWSIHGIQKFYVNSDNKVYRIHYLIAFA